MSNINTMDDDALLDALGIDSTPHATSRYTPQEERIIAGFEDIVRFYQTHHRIPQYGENNDIFERLYAVRLEQIRKLPEAQTLLATMDTHGLLSGITAHAVDVEELNADALLAQLGMDDTPNDITMLRNVRSSKERQAADEIGKRTVCADFENFKPQFSQVQMELKAGIRQGVRFKEHTEIQQGDYFILGGQIAFVAWQEKLVKDSYGKWDGRLRIIFDNGTESNILLRSLQKALYKDDAGRRVTDTDVGPLFDDAEDVSPSDDRESGTIYVLRSQSNHPFIVQHRELIHKIGVTGGKVETRIAAAATDATYLLADVEIVATYKLHNINRIKLENLLHRLFQPAQIDVTIEDRFGNPVQPREWFLVPLPIIDEAVRYIQAGSITDKVYDPLSAQLIHRPIANTAG